MARAAIVSFRLGLSDGVSIVARLWKELLGDIGFDMVTVAAEGPVDRLVPGLGIDQPDGPDPEQFSAAVDDVDLVVVANLCTIPLNLPAARTVAGALAGRPAILHHHDPPWQRERFASVTELPPDDPSWRHVVINRLTAEQFAQRGLEAAVIYNGFDTNSAAGDRDAMRARLGVAEETLLVVHPVRAIPRKNIPAAIAIAEELEGTYWLMGQAEEGYDATLDQLLADARCPVIHRPVARTPDIYAAADLVVFPSHWEGFGNPPVEAAIWRRPCVVGDYLVAEELAEFGFRWFSPQRLDEVRDFLECPDANLLDQNQAIAQQHFSLERVRSDLVALLDDAGWLP
ncbi:glycosyltransferase family 4 protein [Candidatus Poriferisocius sp.]|uniref:glycosyltransferase family 4 protein n=1 Tax=Candidatus Poriferisocius sp. TaxID=3101276 RepID=UPI003B01BE41